MSKYGKTRKLLQGKHLYRRVAVKIKPFIIGLLELGTCYVLQLKMGCEMMTTMTTYS